jgi:hypothetical protein
MDQPAPFTAGPRFEVRRKLGAGGMGVVYEAYDRELDQLVALKTLRRTDARLLARFKREFRSLHDFWHPNVVALGELFDGEGGGEAFFTMELVRGVNLLAHVRGQASPLPDDVPDHSAPTSDLATAQLAAQKPYVPVAFDEGRLRAALRQLAFGLAALHRSGRVHRDIKPSNVMVTPEGRVVLLDFGLVTETRGDRRSTDGLLLGTVGYMAPELALSGEVTPAADWYGFGVVLYEALTGILPYPGRTPYEVILNKQKGTAPAPSELARGIPADLDALCVALLRPDPSQRPDAAEVLARLGAGPAKVAAEGRGAASAQTETLFVGRSEELRRLDDAYQRAALGPLVCVVEGVSGVGKTKLVEEFVERLGRRAPEPVVLAGRCYEREAVSYKAFDGIADALATYLEQLPPPRVAELMPTRPGLLGRLFPVLKRIAAVASAGLVNDVPDLHHQRERMFAALRELFVRLASRRRLVWFIDDLQWTDADSLALLQDLLANEDRPPVLLIATVRPVDNQALSSLFDKLATVAPVERIRLDELLPGEARALAGVLLPGRDAAMVAGVVADAGGHPLLLHELSRHADSRAGADGPAASLEAMLAERIGQLASDAQALLQTVAIAGGPIPHAVAALATGMSGADELRVANVLRAASLVRTDGVRRSDRVVAYHDRVREHVCASMDRSQQARVHERLALALEQTGAAEHDPRALVDHARAAGRRKLAAGYAEAAARHATSALAFDQAAAFLATAIELGDHDAATLRRLRIDRATALMNAGRGPEAAKLLVAAAEGAEPAVRLDCQRQAAEQWIITGHLEHGMAALRSSLADTGETLAATPRRALANVLWNRARLRLRGSHTVYRLESQVPEETLRRLDVLKAVAHGLAMVDNIRGADFNGRLLLLARKTGEPRRLLAALATEVVFLASQGGSAGRRARRLFDELVQVAEHCPDDAFKRSWLLGTDGAASYLEGRFATAVDILTRAEDIFAEGPKGLTYERNNTRVFRIHALRVMGALRRQGAQIAELVRGGRRRGDQYLVTTLGMLEGLPLLARGDVDAARASFYCVTWTPPEQGFHLQHWYELRSRSEIALHQGEALEAQKVLADRFAALRRSMLLRVQIVRADALSLQARLGLAAAGRTPAAAHALVRRLAAKLGREGVGYAGVYAALLEGAIAAREAPEAAATALRRAIALAEEHHLSLHLAAARHHLGGLLGGDEGGALRAAAAQYAAGEELVAPTRLYEIVAPGFPG